MRSSVHGEHLLDFLPREVGQQAVVRLDGARRKQREPALFGQTSQMSTGWQEMRSW